MMRVRALLLTTFVVAAMALAACGGAATTAPAGEAAPAAETATEAAPAAETATEAAATPAEGEAAPAAGGCSDPLGCVTIAAGEPIKIAYAMVTSGPNGSLGIDSQRGMEIAVEDLGGELLGHPIEIVGEDTGCSPEGGQAAASK